MNKQDLAVVTGASSGIGLATTRALLKQGIRVIGVARRTEALAELQREFSELRFFSLDIRNQEDVAAWAGSQQDLLKDTTILINNAGLAKGTEKIDESQIADWEAMIDTNVKGLLYFAKVFLPIFKKNNKGHVVNLGSVAGRWVYPGGAVYCATKFAVRALSEGMRLDLMGTPIRVTNIEPGMVETEFSLVRFENKEKAEQVYAGMVPLSADDIMETILWCLNRPPHVNISELVIYPTAQAGVGYVHRNS